MLNKITGVFCFFLFCFVFVAYVTGCDQGSARPNKAISHRLNRGQILTAKWETVNRETAIIIIINPLTARVVWGTTDDFKISFLHFSLLSTALWDLATSRPVYSLMLSSHLFRGLPCLLPPFIVPCKMVLARPDERET